MAIEYRNGRTYYYRKRRVGGRVRSDYVCGGELAPLAEAVDRMDRERREQARLEARAACEAELAVVDAASARAAGACDLLAAAAGAALRVAGYYQHKREWRRSAMPLQRTYQSRSAPTGALKELVAKAGEGDVEAIRAVRAELAEQPERFVEVCRGDLFARALSEMTHQIATYNDKTDYLEHQALEVKAGLLLAELAGPCPSAVERLLAERAVLGWIELHWLDDMATIAHYENKFAAVAERIDRRRQKCHNRYLASLKALAAVRRLPPPLVAVQVVNTVQQANNP